MLSEITNIPLCMVPPMQLLQKLTEALYFLQGFGSGVLAKFGSRTLNLEQRVTFHDQTISLCINRFILEEKKTIFKVLEGFTI